MSSTATLQSSGATLEGLAFFGNLGNLPYPMDSPVWENAGIWRLEARAGALPRATARFTTLRELTNAESNAPVRARLRAGLAGHEWITQAI